METKENDGVTLSPNKPFHFPGVVKVRRAKHIELDIKSIKKKTSNEITVLFN